MKKEQFIAGADDEGRRLDRVLRKILPNIPLSRIYTSLRTGFIRVNTKKAKPSTFLATGDVITVAQILIIDNDMLSATERRIKPNKQSNFIIENNKLDILFINKHIMIINKSYNIAVQGGNKNEENIASLITNLETPMTNDSLAFTPAPLHRLDKKTTGLLVISQSIQGAQQFSKMLQEHAFTKTYLGIVEGFLDTKESWEDTIEKDKSENKSFKTVKKANKSSKGKLALTRVEPLSHGKYKNTDVTLVKYTIITGRTHQIRLQTAIHGYPLLGDSAYNPNGIKLDNSLKQDFFLHAYELQFSKDNSLEIPAKITAPLNDFFEKMNNLCLLEYDK